MEFLKVVAVQQTVVWVVFSIVAVTGILAHRRWGVRGSAVVVLVAWPVFLAMVLLNELRGAPHLLELNPIGHLFRILMWKPATLATAGLVLVLWLARRVTVVRRAIVWGVGSGAVWAYVMPVPIALISIALMPLIPIGTAEYYHVDFRPMGLEVLESGKPQFRHYTGDAIPLRYRAELDGREIEVRVEPAESTSAQFKVRAVTPDSPLFTVDGMRPQKCGNSHVVERINLISVDWAAGPQAQGQCYEQTGDASLTIGFTGSDARLTLHGPVVKAGEYYLYDSL